MKAPEWVFVSEQAVKSQIVPNDEYNNSKEGKKRSVCFVHPPVWAYVCWWVQTSQLLAAFFSTLIWLWGLHSSMGLRLYESESRLCTMCDLNTVRSSVSESSYRREIAGVLQPLCSDSVSMWVSNCLIWHSESTLLQLVIALTAVDTHWM